MDKVNPSLTDFEAVIFDMDGVLIDSEPLWKIAMQEAFDEVGCQLTKKDFQKTVGLRIDQVIEYWYSVAPWEGATPKELEQVIITKMVHLIETNGLPLPGVIHMLHFLQQRGLKIGLGTSSYRVLIDVVLKTLHLTPFFNVTHSAEQETYGKPHPAVYLTVAQKLGVSPRKCLVIEDSFAGLISGKAAGMQVCVIPEKSHEPNAKLLAADFHFETMADLLVCLSKA